LNTLWAPAWNVVIVYYYDGMNYDSVLYGYGFNRHWFWLNGFKLSLSNGNYISFVIWKDFNCVQWITINPNDASYKPSSYITAENTAIIKNLQAGYAGRDVADIWKVAQDIQTTIASTGGNIFSDKNAYSVIATQSTSAYFFAKVCAKDFIFTYGVGISGGSKQGAVLIFQMRAS
jgi:hypothetical protein